MTPTSTVRGPRLRLSAFLAGNAVSLVGSMLTTVAVPWFVLQTTGSAAKTGVTGAATALPVALAGLSGGALVDRLGFKRASIAADLASGGTIALIPLLYHAVGLDFWPLVLLVFLAALCDAPGLTARQSLMPALADPAALPLERANAAFAATSFGVSALLVGLAVPRTVPRRAESVPVSYRADLAAGLGFVRRDRLIISSLAFIGLTNLLGSPLFAVILPVYARDILGSALGLGVMIGGFGGGALVGTLVFFALAPRLPRRATFLVAFGLNGAAILALATTPRLLGATSALIVAGLAAGPLNPLLMTVVQERTPEALRGRVFGTIMAGAWVAMPLGMLGAGVLLQRLSVGAVLFGIGAVQLAASLGMVLNPTLKAMSSGSSKPA